VAIAARGLDTETAVFVTALSIGSGSGRMLAGAASDLLAERVDRPWFLAVVSLTMLSSDLLLAFGDTDGPEGANDLIFTGVLVAGLGYGMLWSLVPTLVFDLFEPVVFGMMYSTITSSAAASSALFSVLVTGLVYDAASDGEEDCTGRDCFFVTFLTLAGCTCLALLSALALVVHTKPIYAEKRAAAARAKSTSAFNDDEDVA